MILSGRTLPDIYSVGSRLTVLSISNCNVRSLPANIFYFTPNLLHAVTLSGPFSSAFIKLDTFSSRKVRTIRYRFYWKFPLYSPIVTESSPLPRDHSSVRKPFLLSSNHPQHSCKSETPWLGPFGRRSKGSGLQGSNCIIYLYKCIMYIIPTYQPI